jgi:cytochrome c-type biogenesis protein CcsB
MALLLLKICAVFYVLVAVIGFVQLLWPRENGERLITVGLLVSILAHALAIGGRTVELGTFPMVNLHDALSVFGFLAALIASGIAWKSGVPQAAPLAALMVAILVSIAVIIGPAEQVPESLRSIWLPVHIALAFLGDAAFAIAGVVSFVYLVQERKLKAKKKRLAKVGSGVHKLPALEVLDKVSVQLIEWGFPLMTLGLITGAVYSKTLRGVYWSWDPLNTISLVVWVLYAALLHARLTIGWRGRKLAILTVLGVVLTLVSFVGLGLSGAGAHGGEGNIS